LDDRAQRVAVRGDEDGLAGLEIRDDVGLPVGKRPLEDVLEALARRDGLARVTRITVLGELRTGLDGRRRDVVGTAPEHELLLAVLVADLLLVLSLQRAVVTLVETPVTLDRNPVTVGAVKGEVRRRNGAAKERGVDDVRRNSRVTQEVTAAKGFVGALVGQRDIDPAGEEVLGVPVALAVAEQDKGVGHGAILSHGDGDRRGTCDPWDAVARDGAGRVSSP